MDDMRDIILKVYNKTIWSRFMKGITNYKLIQPGDRIAVCISGGKDSMLLAKCMQILQSFRSSDFEVVFLSMDPGYSEANREKNAENADKLGIPVTLYKTRIFSSVDKVSDNPCFLCARLRRGSLYKTAQELGCNKIALGHHFDDVIETILMGMLYGSQVQTMMPKLYSENYEGMQVIRPLYLVRESDIISWKEQCGLDFIDCACSVTEKNKSGSKGRSKRHDVKMLLRQLRQNDPAVDMNIFRSVENVNLQTLISYHKGEERHHFLDDYDMGITLRGTKTGEKRKK